MNSQKNYNPTETKYEQNAIGNHLQRSKGHDEHTVITYNNKSQNINFLNLISHRDVKSPFISAPKVQRQAFFLHYHEKIIQQTLQTLHYPKHLNFANTTSTGTRLFQKRKATDHRRFFCELWCNALKPPSWRIGPHYLNRSFPVKIQTGQINLQRKSVLTNSFLPGWFLG